MPGTAALEIDPPRILIQQSATCRAELHNTGKTPLRNVNPENRAAGPTILLTDTANGDLTRVSTPLEAGIPAEEFVLMPGKKHRRDFPLGSFLRFPGPGVYELRANYVWDDGEATSPPVRVEVLAAAPEAAHIVSAFGGAAPTYAAAWVNVTEAAKSKRELWLTMIGTSGKPTIDSSVFLADVSAAVQPVLSVPANEPPDAQWVVWIADRKLWCVAHKNKLVSEVASAPLENPAARLLAPALLNPFTKIPAVDVLLAEPAPDGVGCKLRVLRISLGQPPDTVLVAPMPGPRLPQWSESVALPTGMRYSFVAQSDRGKTTLHQFTWTFKRPEGMAKELGTWPGLCIGGAQWLTEDNRIVGVLLLEGGEPKQREYRLQHWALSEMGAFGAGRTVRLGAPDRMNIARAIVSINVAGNAHALIATDPTERSWSYVSADGKLHDLPADAQPFATPAQVLYRRMEDPTILFSRPPLGFEFAKPE